MVSLVKAVDQIRNRKKVLLTATDEVGRSQDAPEAFAGSNWIY